MDDLGPIEIEFIINNPEVTAAAGQVEATLQGVTDKAVAQGKEGANAVASLIEANEQAIYNSGSRSIASLKLQLAQLQAAKELNFDPSKIGEYNQQIEQVTTQITKLSNAGKTGYDELGNQLDNVTQKQGLFSKAVDRATNLQAIGSRVVSQFTRQIIGLGVGYLSLEIGAKAIKSLIDYISALDAFNPIATVAEQKASALEQAFNSATYTKAVENIEKLQVTLDLASKGIGDSDAAINMYNETIGKTTGFVDTLTQAQQGFVKNSADYIRAIELEAAAQILLTQSAQFTADTFTKNQKLRDDIIAQQKDLSDFNATQKTNPEYFKDQQHSVTTAINNNIAADKKAIADNEQREADYYSNSLKGLTQFYTQRAAITQKFNGGAGPNTGSDAVGTLNNKIADNELETRKLQDQAIVDNEKAGYAERIKAAQDFENAQIQIVKNNEALQLSQVGLSGKQKQEIQQEAQNKILEITNNAEKQIQSLQDKSNQSLKDRITLLNEIAVTVATVNTQQLSADQKALTDISNKYDALYQKITAFNNDPKNKNAQISQGVVTGLQNSEQGAISNQADLNENKYIQQDIETKKKFYADYEAYRSKVGSTIADNDYADLLKSGKDFQAYLTNVATSVDKANNSPAMQQRQELINKQFIGLTEDQRKQLEDLLAEYATYQDKRELIIENGARNEAKLRKKGDDDQAAQAAKNTQDQLTALDEGQFKQLDSYKSLYDNINQLSRAEAIKQVQALEALAYGLLQAGQLTPEAFKKIFDSLSNTMDGLKQEGPQTLEQLGSALKGLAGDAGAFDDELGKVLTTTGTIVSSIGAIEAAMEALKKAKAASDLVSELTSVVGIVAAGVTILTSIVGLFSHAAEKAAQLQYENQLQLKAIQAINTELQRQLDLIDQIYGPAKIAAYQKQLNDIVAAQAQDNAELTGRLSLTGNKILDDAITKYNAGQELTTTQQLVLNDVIKKFGSDLGLAGKSLTDLQTLMDNGKLDDATAAIVQSLIDLQQQAIATQNALNETLTGSNYDDLVSGFNDLFANATTTVQDFAAYFQKTIQTAILKSFETQYVDKQMQQFYNDLAADTQKDGGTLTAADVAALRAEFNKDAADAQAGLANIEKATGVTVTDPNATTGSASSTPNTLAGQISGITADQANILEGSIHGMQLAVVEANDIATANGVTMQSMYSEMKNQTMVQMQIAVNTKRTADNTDTMVASLENIDSNTSSSNLTNVLRAAGK